MNQIPPIPSETVVPVQVSQLAGLTHSAAIESLIQQNIDLTTRLNINLRRVADMERMMQNFSAQGQSFESQKEAFREEIVVLHKRFQTQESKLLNYRLEKENAEKAYATLVIDHKALKEKMDIDRVAALKLQQRFDRFKDKIHSYIRPLFKSANADSELLPFVQSELRLLKRYRSRMQKIARPYIRNLKFQLSAYRDRCDRLELKTSELAQRIEELLNHLRTRTESFEADQQKLVSYHEGRWASLNTEFETKVISLENMSNEISRLRADKEKIEEESLVNHNHAISAERRLQEIEQRYQNEIINLQDSIQKYSELWNEASQKVELFAIQLEAAQRLNSSLSQDFEEERKKSEELNARIRQMKIQEVAQQSAKNAEVLLAPNPTVPQEIVENDRPYSKLETLFAEIQSGDLGQGHEAQSMETESKI